MLDLKRQYESIKDDDCTPRSSACLTSQHFIGGPELDGFERRIGRVSGCARQRGLRLWHRCPMAGAAGVRNRPGQTSVITTPFSFFASVSSIVRCGATPVLADIDPATLNLDPQSRRNGAETRTRAPDARSCMPVHLYGQCCRHGRVRPACAGTHGLNIVEDAAQAFGAGWKGKKGGYARQGGRIQLLSHQEFERVRRRRLCDDETTKTWRTTSVACEIMAAANATITKKLAGTAASMPCKRRCCASSCRTSTTGTSTDALWPAAITACSPARVWSNRRPENQPASADCAAGDFTGGLPHVPSVRGAGPSAR